MTIPGPSRPSFYKYYSAESAKVTLSQATRKWSTPLLFNDPFDNQFELRWEEPSRERARAHVARFQEIVRSPVPIRNGQFGAYTPSVQLIQQALWANPGFEFTDDHVEYIIEGAIEGQENIIERTTRFNSDIRVFLDDTTILCLSETFDDVLMWSHYANNHTGCVVEFLALQSVDSPLLVAQPVRYSGDVPRITFDVFFDHEAAIVEIINIVTLTKSEAWAYEKEWRIVTSLRDKTQSFEIIPFARDEVAAVYLGCRMTPEDRAEVIGITRLGYPKAKVLQAAKHEHRFALTFREID